jgi:hypothetical protein
VTWSALEGFSIKQGMIKEAQAMHQERIAQIAEKERRKAELEALREQRLKEKEDAEAPEKEALDYYRQLEEEEKKKKVGSSLPDLVAPCPFLVQDPHPVLVQRR